MREEVANLYNGPKWKQRVHRMSEKQIYAIFMKETEKGRQLKLEHAKKIEDTLSMIRPAPEQLLLDLGIKIGRERE